LQVIVLIQCQLPRLAVDRVPNPEGFYPVWIGIAAHGCVCHRYAQLSVPDLCVQLGRNVDDVLAGAIKRPRYPHLAVVVARVDLNRDPIAGIPAVVQVVAIAGIIHVQVVAVIPSSRPVLWPGVKDAEPKAPELKGGISANDYQRLVVDAKGVTRTEIAAELVVWNSVTNVAAALPPGAVFRLPPNRAMLLPDVSLLSLLHTLPLL